jgi:predicted RNA-binding Zn-ribbon protein involved in translation (DUF1610 family)
MPERTSWETNVVEYETTECVTCGKEVATETNSDELIPDGIGVVIGGGSRIKITNRASAAYLSWKGEVPTKETVKTQYMCPSCAGGIYGFQSDQ